jgi:hypothetical protein
LPAGAVKRYVLRGRVVTMNAAHDVIPDGFVCVADEIIVHVGAWSDGLPAPFDAAKLIATGGSIYPGPIELHNHPSYNFIPMWPVVQHFDTGEFGETIRETSLGFFDLAIAVPSIKAALEAWGADSNLFHQGAAKESDDPYVIAATMAARPVDKDAERKAALIYERDCIVYFTRRNCTSILVEPMSHDRANNLDGDTRKEARSDFTTSGRCE